MILTSNLPCIVETAQAAERALDVGGWFQPLNCATNVFDLGPYATRHRLNSATVSEDGATSGDA